MDSETKKFLETVYDWLAEKPTWNKERLAREADMKSSCFYNWEKGRSRASETSKARIRKIMFAQRPTRDEELKDYLIRYPGMDADLATVALHCVRAIANLGGNLPA